MVNHNENKDEMKNRPHRFNINRPRARHGHKCSKYKNCLITMMVIFIKQQLSNICGSIRFIKKLSNTKAELK